jgi:hypothetical protein
MHCDNITNPAKSVMSIRLYRKSEEIMKRARREDMFT